MKAKNPVSARLELVRERLGFSTWQAFRSALISKDGALGGFEVSYSAVRNYHYDREPPVSYLARIAKKFGVRLDYLATGDGPMMEEELRANEFALSEGAAWLMPSRGGKARAAEVFGRFHAENKWRAKLLGEQAPTTEESLEEFTDLLTRPIERWRGEGYGFTIHGDRLAAYFDAALLAVSLAIPGGGDFKLDARSPTDETEE